MHKWKFKGCPRCSGDLLIALGEYDWYESCLQCGYQQDLKNLAKLEEEGGKIGKQLAAVGH